MTQRYTRRGRDTMGAPRASLCGDRGSVTSIMVTVPSAALLMKTVSAITSTRLVAGLPLTTRVTVCVYASLSARRKSLRTSLRIAGVVADANVLLSAAIGKAALRVLTGFDRRVLLLPALPFAIWFATLALGCIRSWLEFGPEGLALQPDWYCFPAILLVGMVPAIAMAVMLRRGAPLTPHVSTALGGLAAAGLGNFGLRLFHPQDASIMVLVWQMGTVFVLTALAGWAGAQRHLSRDEPDLPRLFPVAPGRSPDLHRPPPAVDDRL